MKALFLTALFTICASAHGQGYWGNENAMARNPFGSVYNGQQAMQVQKVEVGIVEDIRRVRIENRDTSTSFTGTATGAAIGGLIGSKIGQGKGRLAAQILLGTAGGAIGNNVGQGMNSSTYEAVEVIVRMDNGQVLAITQGLDQDASALRPGDRVRLIQSQGWNGTARIARIGSNYSQSSH